MKTFKCGITKSIQTVCLLLFTIFYINTNLFSQVKFSAVGSPQTISKNDLFDVQYIVENASNVEQIIPPPFKNFTVVSGPTHQSGITNINGNIKQFEGIEFVLKPNASGNFTLPPASAKVNGKLLKTNSISVTVSNSPSGNNAPGASSGAASMSPFSNIFSDAFSTAPRHKYDDYILHKGEKPDEKIKKNLFVNLEVDKTSCYVGEPIIASYKLYTRLKSQSSVTKNPAFNGFSVSDLEMPDNFIERSEKYKGRDYTVYTLRKVQLYPLQAGTIEIEPIEVENNITFIKGDNANADGDDLFYDMMRNFSNGTSAPAEVEEQKVSLQSKSADIIVKPLPAINQPADFKGAAGDFNFEVKLEKNAMTTDEAGNLTIAISGKGNLQMINAPAISWPDGIEAFEPKLTEHIDKSSVPLNGVKVFNYSFTVSRPASYTIPPIRFSYFNIASKGYKTLTSKPFIINVTKGKGNGQTLAIQAKNNLETNKNGNSIYTFFNQLWLWLVAGLIITGIIILLISKTIGNKNTEVKPLTKKSDNEAEEVSKPKSDITKKYEDHLSEAREALSQNDGSKFYKNINDYLKIFLAFKFNYPEKELTRKKINELLDRNNAGIGINLMLTALLENIELNLYAPLSSSVQMQDVFEKAIEVVSLVDKQC